MNRTATPPTPPAAAYPVAGPDQSGDMDTSLPLIAGLAVGLLVAGAIVGALLYRARAQPPKSWYRTVRGEVAEQVALQLKQLRQVATAVAGELDRG